MLDRARETQEKIAARGGFANVLPDTYTTLGNIHEAEGRPNEALSFYEKAKAMYEEFAAQTPTVYIRTELARALNNLGLVRAEAGLKREGQSDVERGKEIRQRLMDGQPLNIDARADFARSYYHLARIQVLSGAMGNA